MDHGRYYKTSRKYLILLVVAILFMSIGYASINLISMNVNGDLLAFVQDGVFITDYALAEESNADVEKSKINNISGTLLSSNIVLSGDATQGDSFISYKVTVYNKSDDDYFFEQVLDGSSEGFADYSNITYELDGLTPGDMLYPKESITFTITFKYVEGVVPSEEINNLVSTINFKFETIDTLLANIKIEVDTLGKFEDINTVLNKDLVVYNNNVIPIKIRVNGVGTSSLGYADANNVDSLEIPATGNNKTGISMYPVSGFVYLGAITTTEVDIDLVWPCVRNITEKVMEIDTYGSPFTEIITLYDRYDTVPDFTENIDTEVGTGVFKTAEGNGEAQYFRGVFDNNYVEFGGHLWRVMRLNSDGTIRLVLNTPFNADSTTAYFASGSTIYNGSDAKTAVETWYKDNLLTNYNNYIYQDSLFIHDRVTTDVKDTSSGNMIMNNWMRLVGYYNNGVPKPTIDVKEFSGTTDSIYSKMGNTNGNGLLTYPVGLLTADEIMFAGGTITRNSSASGPNSDAANANLNYSFFISNDVPEGVGLWTMTPFTNSAVMVFKSQVGFFKESPTSKRLLKPVIELNADLLFEGEGTESNPYIIYE